MRQLVRKTQVNGNRGTSEFQRVSNQKPGKKKKDIDVRKRTTRVAHNTQINRWDTLTERLNVDITFWKEVSRTDLTR